MNTKQLNNILNDFENLRTLQYIEVNMAMTSVSQFSPLIHTFTVDSVKLIEWNYRPPVRRLRPKAMTSTSP
jgi:hypothetical protein